MRILTLSVLVALFALIVGGMPARSPLARAQTPAPGSIATFAGGGVGDGGPATGAALGPHDVAVDSAGALYIADFEHCRVRKVSAGTITTVAGTGACTYNGDGGPATVAALNQPLRVAIDAADNLYVADVSTCRVRRISRGTIETFAGNGVCTYNSGTGDGGPATPSPGTACATIAATAAQRSRRASTLCR